MGPLNATLVDGTHVAVRIGLHTGPVVVADGGEVFGETANVAARVQGAAEPDTVVITAATQRLVAGMFVVEEREPQTLKGVREPVTLYRVLQPSGVRGRLAAAAAAARSLTPFVGRTRELATLREAWERAREGEGQVVLIVGEAGIGKSRLAQEFHAAIAGQPHTWLETGGAPYFSDTSFYAVTQMLQQFFAWRPEDSDEVRATMLARALDVAGQDPRTALPLLAPLLGVPVPAGYPPLLAAPEVARKRLLATLAALAIGNARLQPVVILLEDLHWVDAATLELNQLLVEQGATVPMLLLFTARPEFRAPWPLHGHHTQLNLSRLPKRDVQAMVTEVAARAVLPAAVLEAVVSRTDGVPLFVEELTKAAVEAGARAEHEIPATLADSLMGRLDRLGPAAKEVAQVGSVIGREFGHALLRAVHPVAESELDAAVAKLVEAELVYAQGQPPQATYTFKHALFQDAAYASLLKSRRRALHGRVSKALVEHAAALGAAPPELLAQHYTEAGEIEPAVAAWLQAGESGNTRGAHGEAERHLRRGLAALAMLAEGAGRDEQEFRLQLALGQALIVTRGYSAAETTAAYARAQEMADRVADPTQLALLLLGLWAARINADGPLAAQPVADQLLVAAERSGLAPLQVWAHFAQASTHLFAGRFGAAAESADRALALYDADSALIYPIDPSVATLAYAGFAACYLGRPDTARRFALDGVDRARGTGRPSDRAWAEVMAAVVSALRREPAVALRHAEQTLAECVEESNPFVESLASMYRGWALAEQGQADEGTAILRTGVARRRELGVRLGIEGNACLLAEVLAGSGQIDAALAVLVEGEGACPGEDITRAVTLRVRAELLARKIERSPSKREPPPGAEEVEQVYRESLDVARRQSAKAFELRTATSYAGWLGRHGRAAEGRALLAPIYASFTEGFDTRDLIEAKALLDELR
jgi:tetratricopeptide (TPR) repeat protein